MQSPRTVVGDAVYRELRAKSVFRRWIDFHWNLFGAKVGFLRSVDRLEELQPHWRPGKQVRNNGEGNFSQQYSNRKDWCNSGPPLSFPVGDDFRKRLQPHCFYPTGAVVSLGAVESKILSQQ